MSLSFNSLLVEKKALFCPPLVDIANVLQKGLVKNFETASVEVVDCPDLRKEPFFLASEGLGGSPQVVEIGGPPFLLPLVDREKVYDLGGIPELVGYDPAFVVGAGAGPWPYAGTNCEMIANLNVSSSGNTKSLTRIAKVINEKNDITVEILPDSELRCALLMNLFVCQGKPSKVLKVSCKKRIGEENFISAMRLSLNEHYKEQTVGLGGAFLLVEGKVKQHVMTDFSKTPINTEEQLNNWLRFYNMSAPLVALGTFVSSDPDLDLRLQHFHSFSNHGEAGHYHYDTTPDTVEYLAYLNLGDYIIRIDRPKETHQFGRD